MLSAIKKLFNTISVEGDQNLDVDLNRKVAIVLMIEVALSDNDFDQTERDRLVSMITKKWNLDLSVVIDLIKSAEQQQDSATSLFEHTRVINESFSNEEKIDLIDCLWDIALADGNIDHFEEHTIRKIADLIYVEHQDFIRSKIRVRDQT